VAPNPIIKKASAHNDVTVAFGPVKASLVFVDVRRVVDRDVVMVSGSTVMYAAGAVTSMDRSPSVVFVTSGFVVVVVVVAVGNTIVVVGTLTMTVGTVVVGRVVGANVVVVVGANVVVVVVVEVGAALEVVEAGEVEVVEVASFVEVMVVVVVVAVVVVLFPRQVLVLLTHGSPAGASAAFATRAERSTNGTSTGTPAPPINNPTPRSVPKPHDQSERRALRVIGKDRDSFSRVATVYPLKAFNESPKSKLNAGSVYV
jgi:hypothetical protein